MSKPESSLDAIFDNLYIPTRKALISALSGKTHRQLLLELEVPVREHGSWSGTFSRIVHNQRVPVERRNRVRVLLGLGARFDRRRDLYSMPVAELAWRIANREEI